MLSPKNGTTRGYDTGVCSHVQKNDEMARQNVGKHRKFFARALLGARNQIRIHKVLRDCTVRQNSVQYPSRAYKKVLCGIWDLYLHPPVTYRVLKARKLDPSKNHRGVHNILLHPRRDIPHFEGKNFWFSILGQKRKKPALNSISAPPPSPSRHEGKISEC